MPVNQRPPSGFHVPSMSATRLVEYRMELIEEIERKYTAEIARTTNIFDFNDLKTYCTRRLNEVNEEIISRFAAMTHGEAQ